MTTQRFPATVVGCVLVCALASLAWTSGAPPGRAAGALADVWEHQCVIVRGPDTSLRGTLEESRRVKAHHDVRSLHDVLKLWLTKNGTLPDSFDQLTEKDANGHSYIDAIPKDPWGNDYRVRGAEPRSFTVVSMGRDGKDGTEDDILSTARFVAAPTQDESFRTKADELGAQGWECFAVVPAQGAWQCFFKRRKT